jgi:SAM-dependent methyltransferase
VTKQKFDDLAEDYDRYRPRYPAALLGRLAAALPAVPAPRVIDAGTGTGIALEGLLPRLPADAGVDAIDVSAEMVAHGRTKFPTVDWHVGAAEPFIERAGEVALIVAAQSYQWMDRPRFLAAARRSIVPGGRVAILQNNRDFARSPFLDAYESLLEELSPGYTRNYRAFDVAAELRAGLGAAEVARACWEQAITRDQFAGMTRSSTQVQRALAAHGDVFGERLDELVDAHGGEVVVAYTSELFLGSVAP